MNTVELFAVHTLVVPASKGLLPLKPHLHVQRQIARQTDTRAGIRACLILMRSGCQELLRQRANERELMDVEREVFLIREQVFAPYCLAPTHRTPKK